MNTRAAAISLGLTRTRTIYNKMGIQTGDVNSRLLPAVPNQNLNTANVVQIPLNPVNETVSHTELQSQSERQKQLGTRSVCFRQLSITSASVIHSHGLNGQCAGSGLAPVGGSITARQMSSSINSVNLCLTQQISPSINHSAVDSDSSDIELGQRQQNLLDSVVEARSPVLKYVPNASRALAADKLSTILDCIVSVPDNIDEWRRVQLFSYSCFGVPVRGGKAHRSSLATKVTNCCLNT